MGTKTFRLVAAVGAIVLVILALIAGRLPTKINSGMDAAAVIALVTAVSVGIERTLEGFWSMVAASRGAAWPLKLVGQSLDELTGSLDTSLDPFFKRSRDLLKELDALGTSASTDIKAASTQLDKLQSTVSDLKMRAKDRQQITSYLSAATGAINYLQVACDVAVPPTELTGLVSSAKDVASHFAEEDVRARPEWKGKRADEPALIAAIQEACQRAATAVENAIKEAGDTAAAKAQADLSDPAAPDAQSQIDAARLTGKANEAVHRLHSRSGGLGSIADAATVAQTAATGLSDFLATFTDNPGRRFLSLIGGVGIGIVVASAVGVDMFAAILGAPPAQSPASDWLPKDWTLEAIKMWAAAWNSGLVLTGIVVGLGSNPTHEIISALTKYKETRTNQNTPDTPSPAPPASRLRAGRAIETFGPQAARAFDVDFDDGTFVTYQAARPRIVRFR